MKVHVHCVGKTRNPHFAELCQDYLGRIKRLNHCELLILRESTRSSRIGPAREEQQSLLQQLSASPCSVLLDVGGSELDSSQLYREIRERRDGGVRQMDFFLGGPWGWSAEVREAAHHRWTLSRLTLPHELARVVFFEQLYRALARIQGIPYDK